MKYILKTNQSKNLTTIAQDYEHDSNYRQTNVFIEGIPETQLLLDSNNTQYQNILTDKGILIIDYGSTTVDDVTTYDYSIYDVFDIESSTSFDSIDMKHSGIMSRDPEIESTHMLVLYKDASNFYYAEPMKLGSSNSNNLYRLDIDRFKINTDEYLPNEAGLYEIPKTVDLTKIDKFGIPYKEYFYFNVVNSTATYTINFDQLDGKEIAAKKITGKKNKSIYYIDIDYVDANNDGIDDKIDVLRVNHSGKYLYFQIKGTATTPNQIIVEVY